MTSHARRSSRALASQRLPSEATALISSDAVKRLKAACANDAESERAQVQTKRGRELGDRKPVLEPVNDEPFSVVCELASGSTGSVYLAVDRRGVRSADADRFVAVKRFSADVARHADFAPMFVDAMQLASSVDHPYVCKLLDFGRAGSSYYAASEFLQGEPLAKVLTSSGIRRLEARSPRLIAHLISGMAEGLHAIHTLRDDVGLLGAIHGDVSPRNLFVLFMGSVRITDFGTAWVRELNHETAGPDLHGDLSYFSPEQLEGRELDARSDVWALGVVLWELLTGQKLFRCGNSREAARVITARPIPAPSDLHGHVSPELDAIVLKALSKNRAKRHASARELSLALTEYLEHSGAAVRASEVADWLAALFPTGEENRRELMQLGEVVVAGLPSLHGHDEYVPPVSNAYPMTSRDEPEDTTHIFPSSLRINLRKISGLSNDEPLTGVSLMEAIPLTRRARTVFTVRRPQRKSWRDRVTPFAFALLGAIGGVGLGALALSHMPVAHSSSVHASTPVAKLTAKPVTPIITTPAALSPAAATFRAPEGARAVTPASMLTVASVFPPQAKPKSASAQTVETTHSAASTTGSAIVQTGSVFLSTSGSWDVSDQGRTIGRAPGQFELSAGPHTLVLKSGTDSRVMTIKVPAGAAIVVSVPKTS